MLVDHDDIWRPDKVEVGLAKLMAAEERRGSDVPALVHGDLVVIDEAGRVIEDSFWKLKQIDPSYSCDLRHAVIHATVVGCTITANRALLRAALPVPSEAIMHDWWLNLVAAATGTVEYDPTPHIHYRIHADNVSRPEKVSVGNAFAKTGWREVTQGKTSKAHAASRGADPKN